MKTFTLLSLALLSAQVSLATHLLGGYIQAKSTAGSPLVYEVTVTLYLNSVEGAAATSATRSVAICFGDGSTAEAQQLSLQPLSTDRSVSQGVYRILHTYPGPGNYTIAMVLPNRTNVQNITNSANIPFALNTVISTNESNRTPTLSVPETGFQIPANRRAVFSFRSTDDEGDSLSYSLAKPLSGVSTNRCDRLPVDSYQFPNNLAQRGTFTIDNRTGDLTWNVPTQTGYFSVAVTVSEYRRGVLISQTFQEVVLVVVDRPGVSDPVPPYQPAVEGSFGNAIVTAVSDYEDGADWLTVFPNPVDDRLQVIVKTSNPSTASVQLLDVNGRVLHELGFRKTARQHEQVISMDSLSPGLYFLRANVNGRGLVRKVTKK
jgi:hypothetical protein